MASSWLYASPTLYRLVMQILYGRHFEARYATVAAEIPPATTVIDVCAGDGYLYQKHLRPKGVHYLGLDLSPQLVRWANQQGTPARKFNLWEDEIPVGDIIVMQASLYQFFPHTQSIVQKLLAASVQKVIIAEPIRNFADSRNLLLVGLSRRLTRPALAVERYAGQRFNEQSLLAFFRSFTAFEYAKVIPGGREMVGVFQGQHEKC